MRTGGEAGGESAPVRKDSIRQTASQRMAGAFARRLFALRRVLFLGGSAFRVYRLSSSYRLMTPGILIRLLDFRAARLTHFLLRRKPEFIGNI
jgi:hypothetical protein